MELTRRASKGAVLNQLSMVAETCLLFLFSVVAARGLGGAEYGVYSFIVSMSSLVILISTLGLNEAVNVFMPKMRGEKHRASFLFKRLLVTRLISSAAAGGLYLLFAGRLASLFGTPALAYYFRLSVLYIVISGVTSLFMAYFMGRIDLGVVAFTRVAGAAVSLCAVYILLRMGCGIRAIIIVSILVGLCVLAVYVFRTLAFLRLPGERCRLDMVYRFGFTLFLTVLLDYALGKQIDIILLKYFRIEDSLIGYYNIAFSMYRFLSSFILAGLGGIGLASISEISQKYGIGSTANAWSVLTKFSIGVVLPVMIFAVFRAREIVTVFYSGQFLGVVLLLQVAILLGLPVRLLGGGTNITVLYALGRERTALYCRLSAGVSNLVLDCLLIPEQIGPMRCAGLGVMGAIVATLGTGSIIHVVEFFMARRLIRMKYPGWFAVKVVVASLVAAAVAWKIEAESVPALIVACSVFSITYILLVALFKPLSPYDGEVISRVSPALAEKLKRWNILIGHE
ncbi:MAG: oligosaccharide flippase family protein [Candidatus Tritonobacter lacicola]|nr:oligosaccharide flippase family protein [Candidatus Tritonobacter lacicola]